MIFNLLMHCFYSTVTFRSIRFRKNIQNSIFFTKIIKKSIFKLCTIISLEFIRFPAIKINFLKYVRASTAVLFLTGLDHNHLEKWSTISITYLKSVYLSISEGKYQRSIWYSSHGLSLIINFLDINFF